MVRQITISFSVKDDDLPSEQRANYKQAVVEAMAQYQKGVQVAIDEVGEENVEAEHVNNAKLIDRMLNDCYR